VLIFHHIAFPLGGITGKIWMAEWKER